VAIFKILVRDSDGLVLSAGYSDFSTEIGQTVYNEDLPKGFDMTVNDYFRTGTETFDVVPIADNRIEKATLLLSIENASTVDDIKTILTNWINNGIKYG
jgi:hypothetical protein